MKEEGGGEKEEEDCKGKNCICSGGLFSTFFKFFERHSWIYNKGRGSWFVGVEVSGVTENGKWTR